MPSAGGAARAWSLPAFQLSFSYLTPLLFLGWAYAAIRAAMGRLADEGDAWGGGTSRRAGSARRACFISGRPLPPRDETSALLPDLSEHSAWHYCAYVVRVLARPEAARSSAERHCAALIAEDDASWMPKR